MHPEELMQWNAERWHPIGSRMYGLNETLEFWKDPILGGHQQVTFIYTNVALFLQNWFRRSRERMRAFTTHYNSVMARNMLLGRLELRGLARVIRWQIMPPGLGSRGQPMGPRPRPRGYVDN